MLPKRESSASGRGKRLRAAVILSGAELGGRTTWFGPGSPPLLAVQGAVDTINPLRFTTQFFRAAPRPKFLLELLGAGHLPPYTTDDRELTERRARMVKPGDTGDDARIVELWAKRRHESRRAPSTSGPVRRQTPSPGSGCRNTGLIRGGHVVTTACLASGRASASALTTGASPTNPTSTPAKKINRRRGRFRSSAASRRCLRCAARLAGIADSVSVVPLRRDAKKRRLSAAQPSVRSITVPDCHSNAMRQR